MLKALDARGNVVVAYNKTTDELNRLRRRPLFCPDCKEKVILKAGQVVTPHFAHANPIQCTYGNGEGEEHEQGKLALFHWFKQQGFQTYVECPLPSINQRLDLLVKKNNFYYAIEYQCSPISITDFLKRTTGIISKGISPIWIFGNSYLKISTNSKISLNTILRSAVSNLGYQNFSKLFFYDSKTTVFTIASDLYTIKNQAYANLYRTQLRYMNWSTVIAERELARKRLLQLWLLEKKKFRTGQRKYISKEDQFFMNMLYHQHLHPQYLPSCVHLPVRNSHLYSIPNYIWQFHIIHYLMTNKRIGDYLTWTELWHVCNKYFANYIPSSCYSNRIHPAYDYILLLVKAEILKKVEGNRFILTKDIMYHRTLEDALLRDKEILEKLSI